MLAAQGVGESDGGCRPRGPGAPGATLRRRREAARLQGAGLLSPLWMQSY